MTRNTAHRPGRLGTFAHSQEPVGPTDRERIEDLERQVQTLTTSNRIRGERLKRQKDALEYIRRAFRQTDLNLERSHDRLRDFTARQERALTPLRRGLQDTRDPWRWICEALDLLEPSVIHHPSGEAAGTRDFLHSRLEDAESRLLAVQVYLDTVTKAPLVVERIEEILQGPRREGVAVQRMDESTVPRLTGPGSWDGDPRVVCSGDSRISELVPDSLVVVAPSD